MRDGTLLHSPPNTQTRIENVWAFVSVDEHGNEGVCAVPLPGFDLAPLVAADEARVASLRPIAQQLATMANIRIRLIRLSVREEIEEITRERSCRSPDQSESNVMSTEPSTTTAVERVRKLRLESGCSLMDAGRIIRREDLTAMTLAAEMIDDLRQVVLELILRTS